MYNLLKLVRYFETGILIPDSSCYSLSTVPLFKEDSWLAFSTTCACNPEFRPRLFN